MDARISLIALILFSFSCAQSQEKQGSKVLVGGPCEGCEAIYESGNKVLNHIDTLPGFTNTLTPIKISGIIYKADGKTPASDIVLYIYQTNEKGIYPSKSNSKGWERRHGYIRGWIKTDASGAYTLYTFRPASYPNTVIPQHIHITVKEPDKNEYYIDDFYFDDDPNLTNSIRNRSNFRGGSGIISLTKTGSIPEATRNIILGLNIPNYP